MKVATREAIDLARDFVRIVYPVAPDAAATYVAELDAMALESLVAAIRCRHNGASPEVLHHAWSMAAASTLTANAAAETLAQLRGETP